MKIEQETLGRLVGFTIESIPDPELKSIQRLAAKNENRAGDFGEVGWLKLQNAMQGFSLRGKSKPQKQEINQGKHFLEK